MLPKSVLPRSTPFAHVLTVPAKSTRHRTMAKLGYCDDASVATAAVLIVLPDTGKLSFVPLAL